MNEENKWGTDLPDGGGEIPTEKNTPDPDKNTEERPLTHPYSAGRRMQENGGNDNNTDSGKNENISREKTKYGHYEVHQPQAGNYAGGSVPPKKPRKPKASFGNSSFGKKAATTVALAVIFGLVAGAVFQGVNIAAGKYRGNDSTQIKKTETLTGNEDSTDSSSTDSSVKDIVAESGTVAGVAQATMSSIVAITSVSVQEIPSFFGYGTRQYQSAGSGSGIIVGENDKELLIATNNHVVSGATTLTVCFAGSDVVGAEEETQAMASGDSSGSSMDSDVDVDNAVSAKIKGTDEENDLAVVAVEKSDIPEETMKEIKIAQLGSSEDLVVGEQVVAIGNALGYGQSVTSGWISALNRSISTDDGETSGLIQTDAAINPGNSGGALLNMNGEVIGINAAKYADSEVEGMGYAIPISKAEPILEELMNRETRDKVEDSSKVGYLGVKAADLTTEAIQMYNMPAGAFLTQVTEGGAADKAGIKKGDIIVKLDGQKVSGKDDLVDKLQYYESGETIEVVIARAESGEYKEQTVKVTLGSKPSSDK